MLRSAYILCSHMVNERVIRLERAIKFMWFLAALGAVLFTEQFFTNIGQSVAAYTNTRLSNDLLTLYGLIFGALIVVISLIAPRGELIKKPQNKEKFNQELDRLLLIEGLTLLFILTNVGSYFPDVYYAYLALFVGIQLISLPILIFSVSAILMRLRLFFLV